MQYLKVKCVISMPLVATNMSAKLMPMSFKLSLIFHYSETVLNSHYWFCRNSSLVPVAYKMTRFTNTVVNTSQLTIMKLRLQIIK